MLPYLQPPHIPGSPIQFFGFSVILGLLAGTLTAIYRGPSFGLTRGHVFSMLAWVLPPAFIGGHMLDVIFYKQEALAENWFLLFDLTAGMSSIGGLLAGTLSLIVYLKIKKPTASALVYFDLIAQGVFVGLPIGRLGCSMVHDHPGRRTDFFLAVAYPEGPRHDLGVYEFLFLTFVTLPISYYLYRRRARPGSQTLLLILLYAPVRFLLDGLRVLDRRYFGLTMAQYACLGAYFCGIWLRRKIFGCNA